MSRRIFLIALVFVALGLANCHIKDEPTQINLEIK